MDLFTQNQTGRIGVHLKADALIIIKNCYWNKGILNYNTLVPMLDEKDKQVFCDATYSENEIELLDFWVTNEAKLKLELK